MNQRNSGADGEARNCGENTPAAAQSRSERAHGPPCPVHLGDRAEQPGRSVCAATGDAAWWRTPTVPGSAERGKAGSYGARGVSGPYGEGCEGAREGCGAGAVGQAAHPGNGVADAARGGRCSGRIR